MKVQEKFKNVFTYAMGVEDWCKNLYKECSGNDLTYTFISDFAIADWYGKDSVMETYENVLKSWGSDYKAFTEIVVALNLLSWANDALRQQGMEGRDEFVEIYSDLYYKARDEFYKKFKGDEERDWFFRMTD